MEQSQKKAVKAVETWQLSINWYGKHKLSPEYSSIEEAHANALPFLRQFTGKYLQITYVRNVRYVAAD